MVGEDCLCFPSSQVPESDGAVMTASYHLKQCEIHMYMYMSSRRAEEGHMTQYKYATMHMYK